MSQNSTPGETILDQNSISTEKPPQMKPDSLKVAEEDILCVPDEEPGRVYLSGWRLHVVTASLCLSMFLPNFEVSIVSTSLLTITNELRGFNISSWVVDAYLITYTGLLIVWAKLSDIFGRKRSLLAALIIFMVFSGACGASQTITQLIVFRAFQGIGGSGIYALGMVIFFEMVPPSKYTIYAGLVTMVFGLSLALGPIFGGLISSRSNWRWVFLLNVPASFVAAFLLGLSFPPKFPEFQSAPHQPSPQLENVVSWKSTRRVDFIGTALLLGASIFIITAMQHVEEQGKWDTSLTITLLVLSGPLLIGFIIWERRVTRNESLMEPVFPWRFIRSRLWMGMITNTFFCGTVFTVCIIQIPLRLQGVNQLSTLDAGVRLLPFGLFVPFGSFTAAALTGKQNIPPVFVILAGATGQTVALGLLSRLPTHHELWGGSLGLEVLAGMGTGLCLGSLVMLVPHICDKRDLAVATAAINQFRFLGGSVGLAIVSSVMYSWTQAQFLKILDQGQVKILEQTTSIIDTFAPEIQGQVRVIFAEGYNLQMKILVGLAAMQFVATALMWQKKPIKIGE